MRAKSAAVSSNFVELDNTNRTVIIFGQTLCKCLPYVKIFPPGSVMPSTLCWPAATGWEHSIYSESHSYSMNYSALSYQRFISPVPLLIGLIHQLALMEPEIEAWFTLLGGTCQ